MKISKCLTVSLLTLLFFLPVQAHKLADGWSFVPRDPAVEPDSDVHIYALENQGARTKLMTLEIVDGGSYEENLK